MEDPDRLTGPAWRSLAVTIYLPMALATLGVGAVIPVAALHALDLGASVSQAALVVTLVGVGGLVGALPAGALADRFGEKRALVASLVVQGVAFGGGALSRDHRALAAALLVVGLASSVVMLARQSYVTEHVPYRFRARAMSTLGGVMRFGTFGGPLLGAGLIAWRGIPSVFWLAALACLASAAVTAAVPDVPDAHARPSASGRVGLVGVMRRHGRTFLTLGLGAAALMFLRAARDVIIPLWCDSVGIPAEQTSLVFALGSGMDLLLFYLGGSIMDRRGRRAVAVPTMLIMGACFGLLPLATSLATVAATTVVVGFGNGLSSGVVLTLGSDASPATDRNRFLAGWRLTTGLGNTLGPLAISGVTAIASVAWAAWTLAAVGALGGAWLWYWAAPHRMPSGSVPHGVASASDDEGIGLVHD